MPFTKWEHIQAAFCSIPSWICLPREKVLTSCGCFKQQHVCGHWWVVFPRGALANFSSQQNDTSDGSKLRAAPWGHCIIFISWSAHWFLWVGTWWFGGPVTDGDPAHSRCCFFFSPSSQLVKNIATKSLRPLLLFVFHAGSNRNLHNESTVLFWEFKDKTRWWIVHKMKRWSNHEIIIEATTQYILHTACSRAVCCYHKTNCKKKKKVEKKPWDISLHANIASLPSEQVHHHILYDMNWCSLNSAWMYVSWQSDPIQKNKLKKSSNLILTEGKNNSQEIRQPVGENRGFNRDNGRTTEPERAGPFPVMTRQSWGTICWIHGRNRRSRATASKTTRA